MSNIKSARQAYLNSFEVLDAAAVGVILTRTREPHRAEEALRMWAFEQKKQFRSWNVVRGWQESKPQVGNQPQPPPDKIVDLYTGIKRVADVDGGGANQWQNGVFVLHYPHWITPKHAGIIQCLKEYSREFTETMQRLVLLTPEGFVLPPELQNDIPVLDFELPLRDEMREVYDNVIEAAADHSGHASPFKDADVDLLLSSGAGMTEVEFETALSKAIITNRDKWPNVPVEKVNAVVLESKTEVVRRSEILELMEVGNMDDVAGLELAKEWIGKRKACFTQKAIDFGVDRPKGIVCIGPTGTGKTLFAKAVAGTLGQPLLRFDVGKVFGGIVGQSEERSRAALKQIDAMAPCTVLIDEIDKAGLNPNQGGGDAGTSVRVLGAILTHMQESKAPIFWVFTANRAHALPSELMRKGRTDEVWAVLPPNRVERLACLNIHLRKRKQDAKKIADLVVAVDASEGFVGAEIEAAVKEAVIEAFHGGIPVTGALIARQLGSMKPISEAFAEDFNEMKNWAESNARMASTPETPAEGEPTFRVRRRKITA